MTKTKLNEMLRANYVSKLKELFAEEDLQVVASNKLSFPVVDADGNDKWVVLTVTVPNDDEYDGYTDAEFYKERLAEKEAKAKEKAAAKARKIEADNARRAAKAAQKGV